MDNSKDEKYIYVRGEELLYKLSDAGLLDQLEEVTYEKKYKFRVTDEVKEICDKFFAAKTAEKKTKNSATNAKKEDKGE